MKSRRLTRPPSDLRRCDQSIRCDARRWGIAASQRARVREGRFGSKAGVRPRGWMGPLYPRQQTVSLQRRRCPLCATNRHSSASPWCVDPMGCFLLWRTRI